MPNDPSLENLDPDVSLDSNAISDSSNLDIDSQLGNAGLPVDDEPTPSDDFPVEDQLDEPGNTPSDSSTPPPEPPASKPLNVQGLVDAYIERRKASASRAQSDAVFEEARRREILRRQQLGQMQPPPAPQPPQPPQPPAPPLPPSQQDPVRYNYYLKLCKFMPPRQALELVNQQDEYYNNRFQKQFDDAMKQYTPYFQRQAQEAYVTDLGNLAANHIQSFHSVASRFGVSPEESQAVVMTHLRAYVQAGHRDLADIDNWFNRNSAAILAATIEEKRKMLDEDARSNAKNQYLAGKNAPSTVAPSTKAAANMVSTGQEALMKKDGAITGGAPSGTAPSAANGVIQSLMSQTGLNAFSAS